MADLAVLNFKEFESKEIFRIREQAQPVVRGPGVYRIFLQVQANSLLSTIFVHSLDPGASVKIDYYDFTQGEALGERFDLNSHPLIDAADTVNRITIPNIHNKLYCEATVTGGNAVFGVYATTVATFATDLDAALRSHLEDIVFDRHKGLPKVLWDTATDTWRFAEGVGGAQKVVFDADAKINPKTRVFNMPLANEEYELELTTGVVSFVLINDTISRVQASWQEGESDSQFFYVYPGGRYQESGLSSSELKLYLRASRPNTTINLIEWT